MNNNVSILMILCTLLVFAISCSNPRRQAVVLYVNSYHAGYPSSDSIMAGIQSILSEDSIYLQVEFMDSKRISADSLPKRASQIFDVYQRLQPDVVIASDDNAVRYFVVPYLVDKQQPVVFCGVNWSADDYNLPKNWITGMVEVLPVLQTLETVSETYRPIKRVAVLSEKSTSEESNARELTTLLADNGYEVVSYGMVADFKAWKEAYLKLNKEAEVIFLPTNGSIQHWDHEEATALIQENIAIPTITCDDFMMPYAVYGETKVAREQGEFAANSVISILGGKKPENIPWISNKETIKFFNTVLARKISWRPAARHLQDMREVNGNEID